MASRTLLQLFTLSTILTNQIEARTFNFNTQGFEKNQQYDIITTPVNKRAVNADKQIIPKITHKRYSEFENELGKTKHRHYKKHRSFEKISREHDVYKLKCRDEFKTASKGNNKKKYNMRRKHRLNKSHRALKTRPKENAQYKIKYRDIEKPVLSSTFSVENDVYVRKNIDDFATVDETGTDNHDRKYIDDSATVEEPVSKHVKNPKYKPKFSNHFQKKKRQRDKKVRKVRHTDKTKHNSKTKKHDSEKVISKQVKYKPTLKEDRDSVFEPLIVRESDNEINANSGDILNPSDTETPTIENQDEKESLESHEELLKQNKLPFYVSSTTKRVLTGNSDLINQNIDLISTTISRLTSSKILDFITDRLGGQMLKKLVNSQASKNKLRTKEVNPEKIEQFDILFKKNGDMVMMGPNT